MIFPFMDFVDRYRFSVTVYNISYELNSILSQNFHVLGSKDSQNWIDSNLTSSRLQ